MPDVLTSDEMIVPEPAPIHERIVVSPCTGRFQPLPPEVFTCEGEWVEPGTVVAEIHQGTEVHPVRSSFRGWVMGMIAFPGHSVRDGEALFWIRAS
jgi:biotin carboxyl carrier protein